MIVRRLADLDFRELPRRSSADPFPGAGDAGASMRVVRIAPGPARSPHRHPRSAEMIYVAEGRGLAWQGGETQPVKAGDTVLVPRGVPHATIPADDSSLLLVCFFPDPDLATNIEELEAVIEYAPRGR